MKESRINKAFSHCQERGEAAFIPFITAGDPDVDTTYDICLKMAEMGADIIELGMPFSDPLADGPTIQASSQRALTMGINTEMILSLVSRLRSVTQCPIVLMGYYNPILQYGLKQFAKDAKEAGADGTIIPDLPLEESGQWQKEADKIGLSNVFLVAPNTPLARVEKISNESRGFLYYVSVTGITGARQELPKELVDGLKKVKKVSPVPVSVGFGISRPDQVRQLREYADGIIVGSAIIKIVEKYNPSKKLIVDEIGNFVKEMKKATTNSYAS